MTIAEIAKRMRITDFILYNTTKNTSVRLAARDLKYCD